ncbi:MAG TPA: IS66 family insertion sequence element accessory protein TnpB [Steroidobacteraceae bacterium]|jgi:transposase|nr:IS66 family insertion sequence element accessory protein TnpB [Steroidobacteraceae bacterium]
MRPGADAGTVYLCCQPVDFRKSISGLAVLVEQALGLDPFAHALYVFTNKERNRIKLLYWERSGFCLWYKRLEKEHFIWPRHPPGATLTLSIEELNWLLDGFDLWRQPHQYLRYRAVS